MAERMVAHFGVDIMHIIEDEPGRLIEVDGPGPKRTKGAGRRHTALSHRLRISGASVFGSR